MLVPDATTTGKTDLFAVGSEGLEATGTQLDVAMSARIQHATNGKGTALLTYSNSGLRAMERVLITRAPQSPEDAGVVAPDTTLDGALIGHDRIPKPTRIDAAPTSPASASDADDPSEGETQSPSATPARAVGGLCAFALSHDRGSTTLGVTFATLLAGIVAVRRRRRSA